MNQPDELYRENAYEAEIDRYLRAAQNNEDTDWTRFDEDANAKLVAQLNKILRQASNKTGKDRCCYQAYAAICALEAIDKHIEYCAHEHARICRENGRL